MTAIPAARGCVFDTNLKSPAPRGRFDLVVYDDGLVAIHGSYVRTAMLGASAATGVGVPGTTVGAAKGLGRYDLKRFTTVATCGRDELLARHSSNHFLPESDIFGLVFRRRWYEHTLEVDLDSVARIYRWKPKLNRVDHVVELLITTFGAIFVVQ